MSITEVGVSSNTPYKYEIDSEADNATFALYTTNASRIKKEYNGEGTAGSWWLRSPSADLTASFIFVNTGGTPNDTNASTAYRVVPGFSI